MTIKRKDFPREIFVYVEEDIDKYFVADKSISACAVKGEVKLVGTYSLKTINKVSLREELVVE